MVSFGQITPDHKPSTVYNSRQNGTSFVSGCGTARRSPGWQLHSVGRWTAEQHGTLSKSTCPTWSARAAEHGPTTSCKIGQKELAKSPDGRWLCLYSFPDWLAGGRAINLCKLAPSGSVGRWVDWSGHEEKTRNHIRKK